MVIKKLPHWVLTDTFPAFYDSESLTAIQQTARLWAKVQELIENYNLFIDTINQHIEEYEQGLKDDFEDFKNCIIQTMNDYIETIDMKINLQDTKIDNFIDTVNSKLDEQDEDIAEAIEYMQTNLYTILNQLFTQAITNHSISAELALSYDSTTEELTFSIENGE